MIVLVNASALVEFAIVPGKLPGTIANRNSIGVSDGHVGKSNQQRMRCGCDILLTLAASVQTAAPHQRLLKTQHAAHQGVASFMSAQTQRHGASSERGARDLVLCF
jgi:hypothetical protein